MGRKTVGILTVLLLFGLAAGWYYFTNESKYFNTPAIRAVPSNSAAIIRIQNFTAFSEKLKGNIGRAFSSFPGFPPVFEQLQLVDSLLNHNAASLKYLNNKALTVFYSGEEGKNKPLYLLELSDMAEKTAVKNLVRDYFVNRRATSIKKEEGKISATIYYWSHGPLRTTFCICFYKGLFFASADPDLVTSAARRLDQTNGSDDPSFTKLSKTASPNADLNIFFNRQKMGKKVEFLFSGNFLKRINTQKSGDYWAEIDLDLRSKEILFNGFILPTDSIKDFMGVLLQQKPLPFRLGKYLPTETSFLLSLNLQNISSYLSSYEAMLSRQGELENYKNNLMEPDTLYGVDIQKMIKDHCIGETAAFYTHYDVSDTQENKYLILKIQNPQHLDSLLLRLTKPFIPGKKILFKGQTETYKLGKDTVFKISQIPVINLGELVFGKIYAGIPTSFYTICDSCLILGSSFKSLETYLQAIIFQHTLDKSSLYKEYTENISQPAVIYAWGIPAECLPFFVPDLNPGFFRQIQDQDEKLQNMHSFGWQMGPEKGMIYNIGRISFDSDSLKRGQQGQLLLIH